MASGHDNDTDVIIGRLQELLGSLTSRTSIVQAIIAVETGDQSFRWTGAKGEMNSGGEVREQTPFFIASIDKLYNATIALMLNETNRLNLDDPITRYLPSTITRRLHEFGGLDNTEKITVRHLLTHTSGLADWLEDYPRHGPSLIERVLQEGDRKLTMQDLSTIVRDQLKPHFPPQDPFAKRAKVRYSDTNFMLVAATIEAITQQPLHRVHEEFLYKPLGLRHTYFAGLSQPLDPTPPPMALRVQGQPLRIPLLISSIKGIYSTAADMLTFLRQLVQHKVFQNPKTLAIMQSHWHRFGFPLDRAALRSPGWPIEYGMGTMRFRLPRIFTPIRPMPSILGHSGSTGCWLFYCAELNLFLSGSVDEVTAGPVPFRTVPAILNIFRKSGWRPRGRTAHST